MTDEATLGTILLTLARNAIADELRVQPSRVPAPGPGTAAALDSPGATFVTLNKHGRLRGCIGSLQAHRPLRDDVLSNARAAAFDDPRFAPVDVGEYDDLHVEVSVLSPPEPMSFSDQADALGQLRPGVDGVVLHKGRYRATYLPQVWEQIADPQQFIDSLARKAGLPGGYWDDTVVLERYTVESFEEPR